MRVLVTGASGHIGSAVVPELVRAGHDVVGLARSATSAAAVEALGARVRPGDLTDLDGLARGAADADAVVHLAFDHAAVVAGDLAGAARSDLAVIEALGDVLAGTGRTLVGIGLGSDGATPSIAEHPRTAVADAVASLTDRGVRPVLVGVPQVVHSTLDRHGFLPTLIDLARRTGASAYVDEGSARWPAVHTLDLARLFRLALEDAPAGSQLPGAAEEGVPTREIAEAIGRHLDVPVVSVPAAEAEERLGGFATFILSFDNVMPSDATRRLVGWDPVGPGLIADLAEGHYLVAA